MALCFPLTGLPYALRENMLILCAQAIMSSSVLKCLYCPSCSTTIPPTRFAIFRKFCFCVLFISLACLCADEYALIVRDLICVLACSAVCSFEVSKRVESIGGLSVYCVNAGWVVVLVFAA